VSAARKGKSLNSHGRDAVESQNCILALLGHTIVYLIQNKEVVPQFYWDVSVALAAANILMIFFFVCAVSWD